MFAARNGHEDIVKLLMEKGQVADYVDMQNLFTYIITLRRSIVNTCNCTFIQHEGDREGGDLGENLHWQFKGRPQDIYEGGEGGLEAYRLHE